MELVTLIRQENQQWVAEIVGLPEIKVQAQTREQAILKAQVMALRSVADRLEHEVITSLDNIYFIVVKSNSAEGAALKRLATPIADDEWIVVGSLDEEIDMNAVRERFIQRGYKSKVSALANS